MWYATYITKKTRDKPIQVVINLWCKVRFPFLIAHTATINKTAVIPLIPAYIGGRKLSGSTSGNRTPNNNATTIGIMMEMMVIPLLICFSLMVTALILFFE